MRHDDELAALAATPVVLGSLLEGGRAELPVGDDGWGPKEVVAHLRDCEDFRLRRCVKMRDEIAPFLPAFDQQQLALDHNYATTDLAEALADFERLRGQVLELLASLDEGDWRRAGMHEEDGRITIERHIRHAINHDLTHLRQIAESLAIPPRRSGQSTPE
jgi:hypothetical protein